MLSSDLSYGQSNLASGVDPVKWAMALIRGDNFWPGPWLGGFAALFQGGREIEEDRVLLLQVST